MKTIQIDRTDEEELKALLRAGGFAQYAERIEEAWSFMDPGPLASPMIPAVPISYERVNGPSGLISDWRNFHTTGLIQDFADLKARGVTPSEVSTVGWFRAPDGHLCDAGCYPKYLAESV